MQIMEVDTQTFKEYLLSKNKSARFQDTAYFSMGYRSDQPVTIIKVSGQSSLQL
jgi:hypothetical protein